MPTRGERVITEERVQDQLRNVIDPEIGMDLVELGLIYDVGVHDEGRHVDVTFSLTSPMCPVGDLIQEQVETETLSIEGVETVNAQLTFEPMWSPEMMSPAAKLFFAYGLGNAGHVVDADRRGALAVRRHDRLAKRHRRRQPRRQASRAAVSG